MKYQAVTQWKYLSSGCEPNEYCSNNSYMDVSLIPRICDSSCSPNPIVYQFSTVMSPSKACPKSVKVSSAPPPPLRSTPHKPPALGSLQWPPNCPPPLIPTWMHLWFLESVILPVPPTPQSINFPLSCLHPKHVPNLSRSLQLHHHHSGPHPTSPQHWDHCNDLLTAPHPCHYFCLQSSLHIAERQTF